MTLRLVDDDLDISVPLPLDPLSREAIGIQIQRCASDRAGHSFELRLVKRLLELVDPDLQPPTEKQLAFAVNIARVLGVAAPAEAFRFRGTMSEFLRRFSDEYMKRVASSESQGADYAAAAEPPVPR